MALRSILVSLTVLAAVVACQPDPGGSGYVETAIFPNEASLGSTVAIAIDSNYIPLADSLEHYDLAPGRVQAWVSDGLGAELQATVRAVFPLSAAPSARTAPNKPGRWITLVLLDLPTTGLSVPSTHARVRVFAELASGVTQVSIGTFRLVGTGGSPWLPPTPGFLSLEKELESRSLLRLRAVRRNPQLGGAPNPADAFLDSWQIGGFEFELDYPSCLQTPNAYPNTEAVNGTALVGPLTIAPPIAGVSRVRVVLLAPDGFKVPHPYDPFGLTAQNIAGEGPLLDLAFDRVPGSSGCEAITASGFAIRKLFVTDKNGAKLIDRRSLDTDSSALVKMFVLDAGAS